MRGLCHRFGRTEVLAGVDLGLDPGERVRLAGPNGAGKSTLLRLAAGVLRPEEGSAEVFGRAASSPAARRHLRLLGPGDGFYPALTGRENLRHFARLAGAAGDAGAALSSVGLTSAADRAVATYSTGMARRLALARMALGEARLYLLDEPWRGLDEAGAAWLDAWLDGRRGAGAAWLLVTHDDDRAGRHTTRTAELAAGRLTP